MLYYCIGIRYNSAGAVHYFAFTPLHPSNARKIVANHPFLERKRALNFSQDPASTSPVTEKERGVLLNENMEES